MRPRVVVAMSGGVDSSVAALLLKEEGYDVIGVSLKLWDSDSAEPITSKTCCSLNDVNDARSVCHKLGIPFYVFDYTALFKKFVIDVFVSEYTKGRTPNPCILCNDKIKFDLLFAEAKKLGAAYLATGHHARIICDDVGRYHLHKGLDAAKDQSYFLFHLLKKDMSKILFPVGNYSKPELRLRAKDMGLKVHDKQESMEICFIPGNDHVDFIAKNYPDKKCPPGNFVDGKGNVLGQHKGIDAYTIGQRKGLGVSLGERRYVSAIRPETNEVVLCHPDALFASGAHVTQAVFHALPGQQSYQVKVRYRSQETPAHVVCYDKTQHILDVRFDKPVSAVTPGQALVLYEGDRVIGGGWIDNTSS